MNDLRTYLERQIISISFFNPAGAIESCTILSEENFKGKATRLLFSVMKTCFDRGETESVFFHREMALRNIKIDPEVLDSFLVSILAGSSEIIRSKCLILIEFDMKEKFGAALKENEKAMVESQNFEMASMWKQCFDFITNPQTDIFEAIPQVKKYLSEYAKDELDKFNRLEASIPKMIDRVRGREKARKLLDTLTALENSIDFEHDRKMCIAILKDLLVTCISRLPMPENLYETLSILQRNSWQIPIQKSNLSASF